MVTRTKPESLESSLPDSSLIVWCKGYSLQLPSYPPGHEPLPFRRKQMLVYWKNCKTDDELIPWCPHDGCSDCLDSLLDTIDPRNHDGLDSEGLGVLRRV